MSRADAVSALGLVAAVAGILLLYFHRLLFAHQAAGIALQVAAALLMLWARATLGRRSFTVAAGPSPGGVVEAGPYRYLRHPIYASILYFCAFGLASHPSLPGLAFWLLIAFGLGARMLSEEAALSRALPAYREYAARTRRVVPFLL